MEQMIESDEIAEPDERAQAIAGGWNYRVVRKTTDEETVFAIHEVYYNESGEPTGITRDPVGAIGHGGIENLMKEFAHMEQAFDKDVLDYEDF